jgi:hypothetical protein
VGRQCVVFRTSRSDHPVHRTNTPGMEDRRVGVMAPDRWDREVRQRPRSRAKVALGPIRELLTEVEVAARA